MSDTFYTTTHGDTRAQALDAAKMQAAIYFVDEPFEVSHLSAELLDGRYRLEAHFERVPEELNFPHGGILYVPRRAAERPGHWIKRSAGARLGRST